uniref:Ras association domain family member 10 n=1 Tax=Salmo trutta TaxID=8032 RepID=A0A674F464_SALTR
MDFPSATNYLRERSKESKISVWVCREEKLVSGLSKRTTCADVVNVLLEDQNLKQCVSAAMLLGSPQSYCIVEKWRGSERILPNKTKILRLWGAWGEEQENVRFVLVKNEASLADHGPRSAEARVVLSKESPCIYKGTARATMGFSPEKQRRIVRKAFRKLDKINNKRAQTVSKDAPTGEKMETLVHLVISQDHTIRQQIQRIKELDREIERYEAKVHFDRMKMHGINYVQDTYLVDAHSDGLSKQEGEKPCSAEAVAQFEEYAQRCEEVIRLQDQLAEHEALMDKVETSAGETAMWVSTAHATHTDTLALEADTSFENDFLLEEERIKTQLDTSLYIGLRLNTDLEAIRSDLNLTQDIWGAKEKEIRDLLEKVNSLYIEDDETQGEDNDRNSVVTEAAMMRLLETKSEWVEQARGLSKTCNANDDDSDTGLSSMHSQDSDNPPVLVLCTYPM